MTLGAPGSGKRSTLSSVCRWLSDVKYSRVRTTRPGVATASVREPSSMYLRPREKEGSEQLP